MKKLITLAACLALTPAVIAGDDSETRDVSGFDGIALEGSMDAVITAGKSFKVVLHGDSDQLDRIETYVKNGVLKVRYKDKGRRGWRNNGSVEREITLPELTSVSISGSGDIEASGIRSGNFSAAISGSGDMELQGECGKLKVAVSGSGDVSAADLKCEDASLSIAGSGDAEIYASNEVSVRVSGSGDVDIYGGGRLTSSKISGSSDLTIHSD